MKSGETWPLKPKQSFPVIQWVSGCVSGGASSRAAEGDIFSVRFWSGLPGLLTRNSSRSLSRLVCLFLLVQKRLSYPLDFECPRILFRTSRASLRSSLSQATSRTTSSGGGVHLDMRTECRGGRHGVGRRRSHHSAEL